MAAFLGDPATCPHGHPIPDADGAVVIPPAVPLNEIDCEIEVEILRIEQPELILCEYLEERELLPGTILKIVDEAPYNGPLTVLVNGKEIALGREISSRIAVKPLDI